MPISIRSARPPLWQQRLALVFVYQGPVLTAVGLALLVPLLLAAWDARGIPPWQEIYSFLIPAVVGITSGLLIRWRTADLSASLTTNEALLVTTAAWWTTGLLAAIPFILLLETPSLDALLESISGFTTAGTTMLTHLDTLPRSILLWRSIIQWLGGLGILLIVLIVGRSQGNHALSLLSAEGVKVSSGRLSLNFKQAAYRFTIIYMLLTAA